MLDERRELVGSLAPPPRASRGRGVPPDPANTESLLLYALARGFGLPAPTSEPTPALTLLRSAGVRGEAEAIAAAVSRLLAGGTTRPRSRSPSATPAAAAPPCRRRWRRNGIAVALEAELPVAGTAVGGALVALLEAEFGGRRAADLLRYLRGPSGFSPGRVDWLERRLRRRRVESVNEALRLWQGEEGEPPRDLLRLRDAAGRGPAELAAAVGRLAATMASRPLRADRRRPDAGTREAVELRAAGEVAAALAELSELGELAPRPEELASTIAGLSFRAWSGPVEGRVRIASPYRLRAARFDHVLVGSLQDGEFPRRDRGGDPFLSEAQRERLGLDPRRDTEAEERYLFGVCLALPRRRLFLSYRDSDENGAAESRSPLLDEVRALLAPPPPVDGGRTRSRRRSRGARPRRRVVAAGRGALGGRAGPRPRGAWGECRRRARCSPRPGSSGETAARLASPPRRRPPRRGRLPRARPAHQPRGARALARGRGLRRHHAGGVRRLLLPLVRQPRARPAAARPGPRPAGPGRPDPRRAGAPLPRATRRRPPPPPRVPAAWIERGRALLAEAAAERELGGHPAERAMARRVERLLERFLGEEAARDTGGFEPWLLEARFGAGEEAERPTLDLGGWGLHGAIDRVDRGGRRPRRRPSTTSSRAQVTPRDEVRGAGEAAAAALPAGGAEHWGAEPVGGLYHPLRGTSIRRPRGVVAQGARATSRLRPLPARRGRRGGVGRAAGGDAGAAERSSPDPQRRHSAATPAPARASAATTSAPPSANSPRSAGATGRLATRTTRKRRSDERGAADQRRRPRRPQPTPEQAAAIGARGVDVMLEAAPDPQDRVMVDRYWRLVCRRQGPARRDPCLHLHREGRGRAARADPGRALAPRRRRRAPRPRAARLLRRRLGDDDPRLLQPDPRGAPGGGGDRPRLPRPRRAWRRRGRPAARFVTDALAEFLGGAGAAQGGRRRRSRCRPRRAQPPRGTVAAFEIEGLRAIVAGVHDELRSRGVADPRLPEPPPSDPGRR